MKDIGGCLRSIYPQKMQVKDERIFIMNIKIFFKEAQGMNGKQIKIVLYPN
jgi:hypothetical protein